MTRIKMAKSQCTDFKSIKVGSAFTRYDILQNYTKGQTGWDTAYFKIDRSNAVDLSTGESIPTDEDDIVYPVDLEILVHPTV